MATVDTIVIPAQTTYVLTLTEKEAKFVRDVVGDLSGPLAFDIYHPLYQALLGK